MKIAIVQTNPLIGDFEGTLKVHKEAILQYGNAVDVIAFPELSVCGYYPYDLLESKAFLDACNASVQAIIEASKGVGAAIIIGSPIRNKTGKGKALFNAALVIQKGTLVAQYNKKLLPTYDIFDEARHFEPGTDSVVIDVNSEKVGIVICEDLWFDEKYKEDPLSLAVSQGATSIISLNASPAYAGKDAVRKIMFSDKARQFGVSVVYVNQTGGQDNIVFDGNSFVSNAQGLITDETGSSAGVSVFDTSKTTSVNIVGNKVKARHDLIVTGIRDYIRKCGFSQIVVGSSGGIDSAVVLALATEALGAENVFAVTMPSRFSSTGSVSDSVDLCNNLGIKLYTYTIGEEVDLACEKFKASFNEEVSRLTLENIQARIRGRVLMEFSNQYAALVLATGNKSELSVGYATLYGDMSGALSPIGDCYKMEVFQLARYINEKAGREVVPVAIIDKLPSAELFPGQVDQDSLPPYPVLDAFLRLHLEGSELGEQEMVENLEILSLASMSLAEQDKLLRMVNNAEFKRKQAPPVIKVSKKSFGMGRQVPVTMKFKSFGER